MSQVRCPNCESFKTKPTIPTEGVGAMIGKFICGLGCLSAIFFIVFPPLWIVSFLIIVIGATIGNIQDWRDGVKRFKCKACGIEFKVTKS